MPDFSAPAFSSAGQRKFRLQLLLDSKERQLQQAGTLGQRVLAQQIELEEKIRQLQEFDAERAEDEELDTDARERYRELAETISAWDAENAQLSSAFGQKRPPTQQSSPVISVNDLPREEPERSKASSSSAAQSRRAKNAAHRADDVEFAFEIGSGLLTEVRRLQSLLGERDKAIQDMKEEKDDLEKTVESLRTALRSQEQSSDKFKEENWNLEVTLQEFRTQLSDSQSTVVRLEGEHKRLTKLLNNAREVADQQKNEAQRVQSVLDDMKAKHETDVAQARKHAAGLQRDKSDLQSALDSMKTEVEKASRRLGPRYGSPLTPGTSQGREYSTPAAEDDDVFTSAASTNNRRKMDNLAVFQPDAFEDLVDISPDPSPSRPFHASNHPNNEIEALQQRLAHAQRQISTLKGSLHREKEMRMEYRRKLESSPGYVHDENEPPADETNEDDETESKPPRRLTPYRSGGGRARGRRGRGRSSLVSRLGMAAQSPSPTSDHNASPPPPVPPLPDFADDLLSDEDNLEGEPEEQNHDSSPFASSKRTSVEGMDPMFANVLRKSASYSSLPSQSSPLRHSVLTRSSPRGVGRGGAPPRRSRGGAAFQEARPLSLVGAPEALAAELGIGMTPVTEDGIEAKLTAEMACQTDFEDVSVIVPSPSSPVNDMGVQVEQASEPTPASPTSTSETSCQTDEEPSVAHMESAVQQEPSSPVAARTSFYQMRSPDRVFISRTPGRRTTLTQSDFSRSSEGDSTLRGIPGEANGRRPIPGGFTSEEESDVDADIDDGATETGIETDTDVDDYHDARGSLATESQEDFHSVLTMTDNDFSESDDESIKALVISRRSSMASVTQRRELHYRDTATYEERGVGMESVEEPNVVEVIKEVEVIREVEVIKEPELREMSIQTDTIVASPVNTSFQDISVSSITPTPTPAPSLPASPALFRVGTTVQQFQFVPAPAAPVPASTPSTIRDSSLSTSSFGIIRSVTSNTEHRQSVDSAISSGADDGPRRSRTASAVPSIIDKTRPPMMVVPPPPRQPPPSATMPPPPFVPERRTATTSSASDAPPPRPSSPPPPELIQRATTPTFGSMLSVHGRGSYGPRQHGSSMPPPQSNLRQPPSTSSFRSAANAAAYAQNAAAPSGLPSWGVREQQRKEMSSTSLTSDRSALSPRSSMSSDHNVFLNRAPGPSVLNTPGRNLEQPNNNRNSMSTDPAVIHAITQTMIGEFLYKYTRRTIGKGYGEKRHKRFFWVHPYTKTLYWSSADPGSSNVSESSAKSAYIEGVRSVLDPNPMPPGLYQYSVVISTAQREMKITAPTKDRHDIWLNALKYLLARPSPTMAPSTSQNENAATMSPMSQSVELTDDDHRQLMDTSPQSQRSGRSSRNGAFSTTPRGTRSRSQLSVRGSIGKRSGTPAAEYLRWAAPESPYSPTRSFERVMGHSQDDGELEFELHGESQSDDGFEGLENVRACCDGRHTVGHSGHRHHHHHHSHNGDHLLEISAPVRPESPAWSLRSRTGSAHSHEIGGLFSWGRGDDGKLRFGSRRSTKTVPNAAGDR
ncbi:coiled-coil protein [Suillus paluster]|uniref:coiled-coil protein n=1 Tax=Suillus paluster TaxID=48578 RepID=UPI001B883FDA|nr:coiled-coil protein [Suillus paluster]KAG1730816.1 coiled-coil protein [Suillus paluster]